ncbi:class I SAM-dependent methyltransferase [Nocardioides sp. WS12]|uniref:class I SAM-dependent methyltransferase n=1 Tax=Nocardioides sp. WS12 TaxID=2486272 RepID=UPI0015FE1547|nr:class I SAM-dependent methyltransferase [Nocardioides sp. WS12]
MTAPDETFQPGPTLSRLYPEVRAGGYTRHDGFIEFYTRVNALLEPDSRVLDFGAGRGLWATEPLPALHKKLRAFHERVGEVYGVDVDPVVLENKTLAGAHVITPGEKLSFEDASFDVVIADHVLEHVGEEDAEQVASELLRVLKPGGWFAARTPNKWGMIGIGARAVPNDLHTKVLRKLQPERKAEDVFPVRYSMNTRKHLKRLFPEPNELVVYGHASEPTYFGHAAPAWRMAQFVDRMTPPRLAPTLMIFVKKA